MIILPHGLCRYGTSNFGTLSCFCFVLSGFFSDLLLVRYSLLLAYAFLIVSILQGFPNFGTWGMAQKPVTLAYGNLLWQLVSLAVQVGYCSGRVVPLRTAVIRIYDAAVWALDEGSTVMRIPQLWGSSISRACDGRRGA